MSDTTKLIYPPFWLVWSRAAKFSGQEHATEERALAQAEDLAKAYPGCSFIVLKATHGRQHAQMMHVEFNDIAAPGATAV